MDTPGGRRPKRNRKLGVSEVRIVVLDPYAPSGKLVSILLYDDIPISSTVTKIEPTKGCWYNEVLCSPDEFKYRRPNGE